MITIKLTEAQHHILKKLLSNVYEADLHVKTFVNLNYFETNEAERAILKNAIETIKTTKN